MTRNPDDLDTAAAVLAAVREDRSLVDAGEARILQAAVAWVAMHSVDSLEEAATVWDHGETGMPVAGPGAPPDRGVLDHRVRRRDRAAHRGRQGLPRRGHRAPLPPPQGLGPGGQGRPPGVAGPPDRS